MANQRKKERPGMIIYFDMMKSLSTLQPEEFKALIIAMGDYAMNGNVVNLSCAHQNYRQYDEKTAVIIVQNNN